MPVTNDTTTIAEPIGIVSHPSPIWPGARHLVMAETGRLLAISRSAPLRAAAERLIQEGYSPSSVLVIKDAHGEAGDLVGSIAESLA
jgi:hypothetical protein